VYVQLANLFVPITLLLYSLIFFIWLCHSHFILYNTFSKFLYSSISVQLAMFLVITFLLIFNHLLLQFFLCVFVLPLSSMTIEYLFFPSTYRMYSPFHSSHTFIYFKFLVPVLPLQYSTVYNLRFSSHLSFQSHPDKISYCAVYITHIRRILLYDWKV